METEATTASAASDYNVPTNIVEFSSGLGTFMSLSNFELLKIIVSNLVSSICESPKYKEY